MLMKYFLCEPRKGGKYNVYEMVSLTLVHLGELSMALLWSIREVSIA